MKQNKDSLRTVMDRRLSFLDGRPSCRAAVQQRIAQEEEPEMKRKLSLGFVIAIALVLVSMAAVAAGLLLSPRVTATQAADKALEEKYGITADMQTFFMRAENELEDGTLQVTYSGVAGLEYPLGTYTVLVKDGRAEISWNHDGEDTAGGYDSEIWGLDQLKMMMEDSADETKKDDFLTRAYAITLAHRVPGEEEAGIPEGVFDEYQMFYYQDDAEKDAALNARKLTEEEMYAIGREFIISSYGLDEEQVSRLELYTTSADESGNHFYGLFHTVKISVDIFLTGFTQKKQYLIGIVVADVFDSYHA